MSETAKAMTYEDILEAEKRRGMKAKAGFNLRRTKYSQSMKHTCSAEIWNNKPSQEPLVFLFAVLLDLVAYFIQIFLILSMLCSVDTG